MPATSDPKQKAELGHLNAEEVELVMGLRRAKSDQERCERLLKTLLTEDEADLILSPGVNVMRSPSLGGRLRQNY